MLETIKLATVEKCTGCMACLNICHIKCISINLDSEGFYQPVIDNDRCIRCGKCVKVCPVLQCDVKKLTSEPIVYAAWNKDKEMLKRSSSGGIFGVFAKYIIENGGVVFGATYKEDLSVKHIEINSIKDLYSIQGSKYVQSDIGKSYKRVKNALKDNQYVLFSGTPCQVAGLYGFLGGDKFDTLFTCDLVCHGVPSPGVFKNYINFLETKENVKLKSIEMRTKKRGWQESANMKYVFDNLKEVEVKNSYKDSYMNGFLNNLYLRKSCYNCQYAKTPRESDITLGDFWGIGSEKQFDYTTKQGVSLVLLNSKKGQLLFKKCYDDMFFEKRTLEEAKKRNIMLSQCNYSNPYREQFFKDYQNDSFEELIPKYLNIKPSLKYNLKKMIVRLIGIKNIKRAKHMITKNDK